MIARRVAVLGAGVSGLAAALLLARDGHRVTLVERDGLAPSAPEDAFASERNGIPHFLQPHAFVSRGRKEMIEHLGDVYAALKAAGACDVDLRRKLPGPAAPGDEDLQNLAVRRPLIEWALRKAVLEQHGITLAARAQARGIRLECGAVAGVEIESGVIDADVVVDAMGRRSPVRGWLEAQGHTFPPRRRSECGVIYYSRYYRLRAGRQLPDGPWLFGPRGDLGHMGFSSFPGDNGAFAAVLGVPTGVTELKALRHEPAFEATVARIPLLRSWVDPELIEPITPVLSMGGMQNSIDAEGTERPPGLFVAGDALCHTDPVMALGLTFGLLHAVEIARSLRDHDAPADARAAYANAVMPALRERYELASALDEQRLRMWTGGAVDFTRRDGDYALFSVVAGGAVALVDPDVFRVNARRWGLLESTRVLDDDAPMQRRIEAGFRELLATPRPPQGPSREELQSLIAVASPG